ncbi:helix-turn-helix domain-containing protein [Ammoniphilus sp. CFH 90114]|uniref:helix-turn-helix domain-containing protein n=1 Tax=Ammoniphilus sp. CFH 90114 TaxID=2493665 RepID=UPI00100F44AA|nr:helix-turn-helix domain-containing protein [Ammoniphilus sp. CFH 90114]RXT08931.1 DNA-binding protein [Ammoniphilus sp. CFH 90114]
MLKATLTAKEAASYLGVSYWLVLDAARQRKIPHFRIGQRIMFRLESLQQWIEQQEASSIIAPLETQSGKIRKILP